MATSAAANYASKNNIDYLANINKWIDTNRNATPAQVNQQMSQYGISEGDIVKAIAQRNDLIPGQTLQLGDTFYQPNFTSTGSGQDEQIGPLENIYTYKANENKVGGNVKYYNPNGEYLQTTQQIPVNATQDFLRFALAAGGMAALGGGLDLFGAGGTAGAGTTFAGETLADAGLLSGAETAAASTLGAETAGATTLGTQTGGGLLTGGAGTTAGLSAAELAQLDLSLGGAGGTAGATTLGTALTTGGTVPTITSLTGGSGLISGTGLTAAELAQADLALGGAGGTAGAESLAASLTTGADTATLSNLTGGSGLLTSDLVTADTVAKKLADDALLNPVTTPATVTTPTTVTPTVVPPGLLTGLTAEQIAKVLSGTLTTAGGLLQQQTSREAAQVAQARVDAETAAAKEAAQFRPVGTTTKFGTSNFTYDPVTGQMVSSGYKLTPEAQAQQDRLMALSNAGLTQAEQAQAQFAPLQTGAQTLFGLGNQYLAQSPEEVANKYISQQMNLLAPSRELDLANLQNKLFQQGRSGLAVAQGGNLGATTPELQALYNARAQQDAVLAAQAQQAGQQQVSFGAGLLGQGASAMNQYYGGQQASYAPYTAAMGQVQNLEAQAQQPYNMSLALAQQQATAGTNVGKLGLTGAQLSTNLATSPAATTNPYATVISGLGDPNSLLSQGLSTAVKSIWG
jgi:hypothetical protein